MPRRISSCTLVSSRQTTAARSGPCDALSSRKVACTRRGDSKKTWVRGSVASSVKRAWRSPGLRGGKPSKQNLSVGSPETARAVVSAEGPGIAVTRIPACAAAVTTR
ncbi:MAG: hypothetical protein JWM19_1959 [Actinomycetia bacterium]|nr:hypothetical protein [Actinomycetes bacterium]